MIKVIMHGCNGKMGQTITGIIAEDADVEIVRPLSELSAYNADNKLQMGYMYDCALGTAVLYAPPQLHWYPCFTNEETEG